MAKAARTVPGPAPAVRATDEPIFMVIDRARHTQSNYANAVVSRDRAESVVQTYQARGPVPDFLHTAHCRLQNVEDDAREAADNAHEILVHAEPQGPAGAAAKLRYALEEERRGNPFERRHLLAIISSVAAGLERSAS